MLHCIPLKFPRKQPCIDIGHNFSTLLKGASFCFEGQIKHTNHRWGWSINEYSMYGVCYAPCT